MHVIIASTNHAKVTAVTRAFTQLFPEHAIAFSPVSTPSGVSEQPLTDQETLAGARNRVQFAQKLLPDADFWVGVEGGVDETPTRELVSFSWIIVQSKSGRVIEQRTSPWLLPPAIAQAIRTGTKMSIAGKTCWPREQDQETIRTSGIISLLTDGVITRGSYYEQAVMLALLPFKNPELYYN